MSEHNFTCFNVRKEEGPNINRGQVTIPIATYHRKCIKRRKVKSDWFELHSFIVSSFCLYCLLKEIEETMLLHRNWLNRISGHLKDDNGLLSLSCLCCMGGVGFSLLFPLVFLLSFGADIWRTIHLVYRRPVDQWIIYKTLHRGNRIPDQLQDLITSNNPQIIHKIWHWEKYISNQPEDQVTTNKPQIIYRSLY